MAALRVVGSRTHDGDDLHFVSFRISNDKTQATSHRTLGFIFRVLSAIQWVSHIRDSRRYRTLADLLFSRAGTTDEQTGTFVYRTNRHVRTLRVKLSSCMLPMTLLHSRGRGGFAVAVITDLLKRIGHIFIHWNNFFSTHVPLPGVFFARNGEWQRGKYRRCEWSIGVKIVCGMGFPYPCCSDETYSCILSFDEMDSHCLDCVNQKT